MARRALAVGARLVERGEHLVQLHLRPGLFGMVDVDRIVAGYDLHEVGAFQQLLTRRFPRFMGTVRLDVQHVAMPARDADRRAAGKNARSRQMPLGDHVAEMQPHAERRAHVAHGRPAAPQRNQRVARCVERQPGYGRAQVLIGRADEVAECQVVMHIDQAGHYPLAGRIDDRCPCKGRCLVLVGRVDDGNDPVAVGHDAAAGLRWGARAVEQCSAANDLHLTHLPLAERQSSVNCTILI